MIRITLVLLAIFAVIPTHAEQLTIGIDVSASAPILESNDFAALAGKRAAKDVASLALGDVVHIQMFGERGLGNIKRRQITINRRNRPAAVAKMVGGMIRSIPQSDVRGQAWTNITAFLSVTNLDCSAGGRVLLISDGIESSRELDESDLLAGKTALPVPESGLLAGCHVAIFGLGLTGKGAISVAETKALLSAWEGWAETAGAKFEAVRLQ